jgi:hypothetical protein
LGIGILALGAFAIFFAVEELVLVHLFGLASVYVLFLSGAVVVVGCAEFLLRTREIMEVGMGLLEPIVRPDALPAAPDQRSLPNGDADETP